MGDTKLQSIFVEMTSAPLRMFSRANFADVGDFVRGQKSIANHSKICDVTSPVAELAPDKMTLRDFQKLLQIIYPGHPKKI